MAFDDPSIAGSWPALAVRLDARSAFQSWSRREPALAGFVAVADVVAATSAGSAMADATLAALVRLAAADGGDEPDAVLLLLHLLSPGVRALAARYRDLSDHILNDVVAELAVRIRSFPWQRRHRSIAANLLLDTRAALRKELLPRASRWDRIGEDIPCDPFDRVLLRPKPSGRNRMGSAELDAGDLVAVARWATEHRQVRPADLELVFELERRRGPGSARLALAAERGVNERTIRRHRDRALAGLRQAGADYLAAVA